MKSHTDLIDRVYHSKCVFVYICWASDQMCVTERLWRGLLCCSQLTGLMIAFKTLAHHVSPDTLDLLCVWSLLSSVSYLLLFVSFSEPPPVTPFFTYGHQMVDISVLSAFLFIYFDVSFPVCLWPVCFLSYNCSRVMCWGQPGTKRM